ALTKKYRVKVLNKVLDVRSRDDVKDFISSLPAEWKKIDILVNNAGLARGLAGIDEGTYEDWEEMIDTNIKGLLYLSREVIPLMVRSEERRVGKVCGMTR